ncbi:MAG TPA: alpha/beta hydrolase [Candidatus Limnocylindrales bacterium]|nr:alpha/beta hydrolase [Candidatus Limnocylindrales bacterium]
MEATTRMRVTAHGIDQSLLARGPLDGPPVLLVHGNCSSAAFWEPLLRHLPPHWRIIAPDLRGFGHTQTVPVDATRGLSDFSEDLLALLDAPGVFAPRVRPTVVGHSMGGGIAMRLLVDAPDRLAALVLEAPLSPYGFGVGGAGAVNPDFVAALAAGDRTADSPSSPRNVLRAGYVADPASLGDDEEALLSTVLSTAVGPDNFPGDAVPADGWPGVGPGKGGVLNAMDPSRYNVAEELVALGTKPPILWIHGDADVIVSDTSQFDLAYLGKLGIVPGWPGEDVYPPQPMVTQTRQVFTRYAEAGGVFEELFFTGTGHSPHIERPADFARALTAAVG